MKFYEFVDGYNLVYNISCEGKHLNYIVIEPRLRYIDSSVAVLVELGKIENVGIDKLFCALILLRS